MKLIGLTGNIASGKSTVARLLVEMGAAHLDADQLVHDLYRPGTDVTRAIAERFGATVLAPDGSVDRKVLGAIVFDDPGQLRALEQIVHPVTGARITEYVQALGRGSKPPPALVIEAVKLIESGRYRSMDEVWFVVARPEVQRQRLVKDRGLSEEEAESRLSAQGSIRERLHFADVIIENSGSMQTLRRQVRDAWRRLQAGDATEVSGA
jgi:dephospho-CoA kinase